MNIFAFRDGLIDQYSSYIRSFIHIREPRISQYVRENLAAGRLWPEPLIQLNPSFQPGCWIEDLVRQGVLHAECARVFRVGKDQGHGRPLRLHRHQEDAIRVARSGHNYVLTTGTGEHLTESMADQLPSSHAPIRYMSGVDSLAVVKYADLKERQYHGA